MGANLRDLVFLSFLLSRYLIHPPTHPFTPQTNKIFKKNKIHRARLMNKRHLFPTAPLSVHSFNESATGAGNDTRNDKRNW